MEARNGLNIFRTFLREAQTVKGGILGSLFVFLFSFMALIRLPSDVRSIFPTIFRSSVVLEMDLICKAEAYTVKYLHDSILVLPSAKEGKVDPMS